MVDVLVDVLVEVEVDEIEVVVVVLVSVMLVVVAGLLPPPELHPPIRKSKSPKAHTITFFI